MKESTKYIPVECDQTACPLYSRRSCVPSAVSRPPVSSIQNEDGDDDGYRVDVAIIGSPPTKTEDVSRVPFIDETNTLFRKLFKMGGFPPGGHALLPVIRCMVPEDIEDQNELNKIKNSAIQHCKKYLERDIERVNPKVIALAGPDAILSVTGNPVLKTVAGIRSPVGSYGCVGKHKIGSKNYTTVNMLSSEVVYNRTPAVSYAVSCFDKVKDLAANGSKSMYHPLKWKVEPEFHYCDTVEKIEELVEYLLHKTTDKQVCAFDVETMNLNVVYGNKLVMLQFCVDPHEVWCVPYQYLHAPFSAEELSRIKKALNRLFTETPNFSYWVGHGIVFDMLSVMAHITDGKTISNRPVLDTQIMFYALDENRVELSNAYGLNLKLKTLSHETIGRDAYDVEVLKDREAGSLYKLDPKTLVDYAGNDVVNTYLIYRYCRMVAKSQGYLNHLMTLCVYLFSNSIRLTAALRRNGMYVDLDYIRLLTSKNSPLLKRMKEIEDELKTLPAVKKVNLVLAKEKQKNQKMIFGVPWVFDLNKTDHRLALYIDQLKLKPIKYGKGKDGDPGLPSMDDEFWEKHKNSCKEAELAQEYFGLKKLSTSYASSILEYVDPQYGNIDCSTDSRIRPSFSLTGTTTGRVASFDPNAQNFPKADNPAKAAIKSIISAQQNDGKAYKVGSGKEVERVLLQNDFVTAEVRIWCCKENTYIPTVHGIRRIDDIVKSRDKEKIVDIDNYYATTSTGINAIQHGVFLDQKECLRLVTKHGFQITGSLSHKVLTFDPTTLTFHYRSLSELCSSDLIVLKTKFGLDSFPKTLPLNFCREDFRTAGYNPDPLCPYCNKRYDTVNQHIRQSHPGMDPVPVDQSLSKDRLLAHLKEAAVPSKIPTEMTPDLAFIMGLLISEGSVTKEFIKFHNNDKQLLEDFIRIHKDLFGEDIGYTVWETGLERGEKVDTARFTTISQLWIVDFLKWLGVTGTAYTKTVPWSILQAPRDCIIAFLRGYWEGDGNLTKDSTCSSVSEELIDQIQLLLLMLGIVANKSQKASKKSDLPQWTLTFSGEAYDRFVEMMQFTTDHRKEQIARTGNKGRHGTSVGSHIPGIMEIIQKVKDRSPQRRLGRYVSSTGEEVETSLKMYLPLNRGITVQHLEENPQIMEFLSKTEPEKYNNLCKILEMGVGFEEVQSVTNVGMQRVYDIAVDGTHDYVSNGFISHNCNMAKDKTLAAAINHGMNLRRQYRDNPTPEMKKKAKSEGDQHRNTAANVFNKKPEDVTDDERQAAKSIVFGLMYGRGVRAIAEQLKNPDLEQVKQQCDKFNGAYEDGVGWFYRMEDQATRHLYVESDLFRRRKLYAPIAYDPALPKEHPHRGAFAEAKRQARNSPIQSQSSDFGLIGSFLFLDYIEKNNKSWKIINIVHDSCVAEVPLDELKNATEVMEACFTTDLMAYVKEHWDIDFICPLEVECELGIRWGEMQKWDMSSPDFDRLCKWLSEGGVKDFSKK